MRARGPLLLLFLLLLVAGLAGAWYVLLSKRTSSQRPVFQMPDGTLMQVEGLTLGTNHTFVKGSALLAKLHKLAPGKLKDLLPPHYSTFTSTSEELLLLWYNRFDPATRTYTNAGLNNFRVVDEHNCVFRVSSYSGNQSSSGYTVGNAHIGVFPRRQKTFKVHAQSSGVTNIEWTVENPFVTNPPPWNVEPLPATRDADDARFTLERIKAYFSPGYSQFDPRFTIMRDGENRTDWYKPVVQYSDATGNRDSNQLCPFEPAWKLDVRFYKSHKAPFPENQILRVPNLRIPPSGEFIPLAATNILAGITIKLIALCGPGEFSFSNSVCVTANPLLSPSAGESHSSSYSSGPNGRVDITFRRKTPTLLLQIDDIDHSEELLVRFRDDEGRTFAADYRGRASNTYRYEVKPPEPFDPSQPIHLELIPQKPVSLQYIVQPPRPN